MDKWTYQTRKIKISNSEKKVSEPINITNPFDVLKKNKVSEMDEKIFEGKRIFESYPSVKTSI